MSDVGRRFFHGVCRGGVCVSDESVLQKCQVGVSFTSVK